MKMAMPMASSKPLRKIAPRSARSTSVMRTSRPCKKEGTSGFSTTWTAASAAERVIVTSQPVATKPRRHSTSTLPFQNESNLSSIEIEPCPWGLSSATRLYIGKRPEERQEHYEEGGDGRERPGRERRDARDVAEGGEVVHPREAHDLPPGVLLASALLGLRSRHVLDHFREQPALEPAGRGLRRGFGPRHYAPPEAQRQRQGHVRQDPPSGTRLTSFFAPAGLAVGFGPKEPSPPPAREA